MHFLFEDMKHGEFKNFIKCRDINSSRIRRFTPSPIAIEFYRHRENLMHRHHTFSTTRNKHQQYIIATGVAHAPWDWCGPDNIGLGFDKSTPDKSSLFAHIGKKHRKSLKRKNAFLLIDQSHEGYQTEWLWAWFHNNCEEYGIPPTQIIYVTGNLDSRDQYKEWSKDRLTGDKILVVPYPHFESSISNILIDGIENYPTFEQQVEYKRNNIDSIKTYSALQKRPRAHRAWFFKYLVDSNLLDCGINSMNTFEINNTHYEGKQMTLQEYNNVIDKLPILPPNTNKQGLKGFASQDCGSYLTMFNEQIMLDTWLTVVSEASFGESENECFLSEKTFKPIACCHPFIIAGNKGSLSRLRELGYKTFSPYINEEYDNLNTWERMPAITKELKRINNMSSKDKLDWFCNLKPILEHNYELLKSKSSNSPSEYLKIIEEYIEGRKDV